MRLCSRRWGLGGGVSWVVPVCVAGTSVVGRLPLPTQNASSRSTLYVCESSFSTCVAAANETGPAFAFSETMMR